jgi:hypothetical protein
MRRRLPEDRWDSMVTHVVGLGILSFSVGRIVMLSAHRATDVDLFYCSLFAALVVFIIIQCMFDALRFSMLHSRMLALSSAALFVFGVHLGTMMDPSPGWAVAGCAVCFWQMLYWYSAGPSPHGWAEPVPQAQKST